MLLQTLTAVAIPSAAPLPGAACKAAGKAYVFFAQAWANTCECTGFPPQKRGDQCNWWQKPCGYCCETCNVTDPASFTCKKFDNIMMSPTILDPQFGDNANYTIQCLLHGEWYSGGCEWPDKSAQNMGCSDIPKGHCMARFYDTDLYIAQHPEDFVALPAAFADCGDADIPHTSTPNPRPPSFGGIWWDHGAAALRAQSAKFFPQYKAAGGSLDGLYQDQEADPTRQAMMKVVPLSAFMPKANATQARRCLRARYTAIQNDARFPAVLALLKQRGFTVGNGTEWLADAMAPFSEPDRITQQGRPSDLNRVVWEAVVWEERASLYWRAAFYEVARESFPDITHTQAGRHRWDPAHCPVSEGGRFNCLAGVGASGYNVQNMLFYDEQTGFHCNTDWVHPGYPAVDRGCASEPGLDNGLNQFFDVPFGVFNRSGFSFLVLQANEFRGMALAAPAGTKVRPDVADKSLSPKDSDFLNDGPDGSYEERVLHYGMMGADEYIYFNPWAGFVYGTRATMDDHELLSSLLHMLDDVVGCTDREWIVDTNLRYTDGFYLTGMALPSASARVWRFSPALPTPAGSMDPLTLVRGHGAAVLNISVLFDWGEERGPPGPGKVYAVCPSTLQFEGGVVLKDGSGGVAPDGVWISQPADCSWCVRIVTADTGCDPTHRLQTPWPIPPHAQPPSGA